VDNYTRQDALTFYWFLEIILPRRRIFIIIAGSMFISETKLRVRYAETDQMGVVYHSNYFPWFESARAESIRQLGYTYADMEKMGVIMPVVDVHCRYLRPAKYDDLVTVKTTLKELPAHHKIEFQHEVFNESGELLASAKIILYFMEANGMKRTIMPAPLLEKIKPYF
jgi:acyl-CoA thioester hydrolase